MDRAHSPELDLILLLTEEVYKKPKLNLPEKIDWDILIDTAYNNKILYYTLSRLVKENPINAEIPERILKLAEHEEDKFMKLEKTVKLVQQIITEPFMISKTFRFYPHVTHDVDIITNNIEYVKNVLDENGFKPSSITDDYSLDYYKEGYLEVEAYARTSPGRLIFLDQDIPWSKQRTLKIWGCEINIPSAESEILTFIADMNFRMYQIHVGDLIHMYKITPQADWSIIIEQTVKYGWSEPFSQTISIMNGLHRKLYDKPSPMEKHIPQIKEVDVDFPFIMPPSQVAKALSNKGIINLVKMLSYFSMVLKKKHPSVYPLYAKVFNKLSHPFVRYFYH